MSGQCKSFSRCHSSMHCWPCVPLENCEILLHWFSVSSRQMMKRPHFSSTICRAIIVMATLGKFTAFRGYCHTGGERLSLYFLFCVCWQGIASHSERFMVFALQECTMSPVCLILWTPGRCLEMQFKQWMTGLHQRGITCTKRDVTLLLEVARV